MEDKSNESRAKYRRLVLCKMSPTVGEGGYRAVHWVGEEKVVTTNNRKSFNSIPDFNFKEHRSTWMSFKKLLLSNNKQQ